MSPRLFVTWHSEKKARCCCALTERTLELAVANSGYGLDALVLRALVWQQSRMQECYSNKRARVLCGVEGRSCRNICCKIIIVLSVSVPLNCTYTSSMQQLLSSSFTSKNFDIGFNSFNFSGCPSSLFTRANQKCAFKGNPAILFSGLLFHPSPHTCNFYLSIWKVQQESKHFFPCSAPLTSRPNVHPIRTVSVSGYFSETLIFTGCSRVIYFRWMPVLILICTLIHLRRAHASLSHCLFPLRLCTLFYWAPRCHRRINSLAPQMMYNSFHAVVPAQQIRFMYGSLPWPTIPISRHLAEL